MSSLHPASTLGPTPPIKRHLYSIGVDLGRYSDATVIVVLDVTGPVHDVVHAERHVRVDGPTVQLRIQRLAEAYPGLVTVEDNGPGWAIRENLDLPEHRVEGFFTSTKSKPHLIDSLALAFEQQTIRYDPGCGRGWTTSSGPTSETTSVWSRTR